MNFLTEIRQLSARVVLGGLEYEVKRGRLLKHFVLQAIALRPEPDRVVEYVAEASELTRVRVECASFSEVLSAYQTLTELNRLHGVFPFMSHSHRRGPLDYEGRSLSTIVHLIASSYGWTRDQIFNLIPEEAFFYVLEILLERHEERDFQYNLSQVGYGRDGKKMPFPRLAWVWSERSSQSRREFFKITEDEARERGIIPMGLVITELGRN